MRTGITYTRQAGEVFSRLRRKSPSAEVHDLLKKLNVNRETLTRKLAAEFVDAMRGLAVQLAGQPLTIGKPVPELDRRIGPLVYLLNLAPPRDYDLDRAVLFTALNSFHLNTFFHSLRVSDGAVKMANFLGFDCRERAQLVLASRFHDIGKTAVPAGLLDKPSNLDDAEKRIMDTHQMVGFYILRGIHRFRHVAEIMSFTHIEQGYPAGLAMDAVSDAAHVLIIADTFDACLSYREYREGHRMALRDVYKIIAAHNRPRHPLHTLIAAARAYEIAAKDARESLSSVFSEPAEGRQIKTAFG